MKYLGFSSTGFQNTVVNFSLTLQLFFFLIIFKHVTDLRGLSVTESYIM